MQCPQNLSDIEYRYPVSVISYLVKKSGLLIGVLILWIRVHFLKTVNPESEAENTTFLGVELFASGDCHLPASPVFVKKM
jgi:hypothetical protein